MPALLSWWWTSCTSSSSARVLPCSTQALQCGGSPSRACGRAIWRLDGYTAPPSCRLRFMQTPVSGPTCCNSPHPTTLVGSPTTHMDSLPPRRAASCASRSAMRGRLPGCTSSPTCPAATKGPAQMQSASKKSARGLWTFWFRHGLRAWEPLPHAKPLHKVLCLPLARVPLAIGLPADPGLPPLPGPATHFGAEVHVVLLFLQACHEVATGQAIFDVSEFNEDSYWSLRQRLADIRRFAAATACPRDAFAQNWQVAQPLVNVEYYRMASLLGRTFCSHISTMLSDPDGLLVGHALAILTARATGRSSLCVLGCPAQPRLSRFGAPFSALTRPWTIVSFGRPSNTRRSLRWWASPRTSLRMPRDGFSASLWFGGSLGTGL